MNRPIIIILIGYIIGIIWGLYLKISIVPFYIILLTIYIITNKQYPKKKFKLFSIKRYYRYIKKMFTIKIVLMIIISSFISNFIIQYNNKKYDNFYKDSEAVEITGIVVSNKKEGEYTNRYKIKDIKSKKYLYANVNKNVELKYGDKIIVNGVFQEPQTSRNYKGFNYKEYLKTLKIYGTIKVGKISKIKSNCGNILLQISNNIFNKIKNNIEETYSDKTSPIVLGIMLGYTDEIDEELKEKFSESSISHILAVSGLHISYIIYITTNSSQFIFGKRKSKIFSVIILIIYMFITNFSISVVRACIMGIIFCISFIVHRKNNTLNNIAISALIILINNPFAITGINFQLTYGGTLGIIFFKPTIEKILKSVKIENRKWKYIFLKTQRKCEIIIQVLSTSISAQIIITPIIILKFNTIGITFLLTNLLLNTVIGTIVMGGFIQIIISFISLKIAKAMANIIEIPIYSLFFISKINFGNFKVITPDLWQIVFYYVMIFVLNYLYKLFNSKKLNQTQVRIKNIIFLCKYKLKPYKSYFRLLILIIIVFIILIVKLPHNLKIHFIDVGQGDSTLIITPNDKKILIDGGGSTTYNVGKNILYPYLLDRKISKLDYVIISHFDQDHVDGILYLLQKFKIDRIIIGKQLEISENYQEFKKLVKEKNIKVNIVKAGERINIENNLWIDIIWPIEGNEVNQNIINNNAIVCKLNYFKFTMLFTGDIEQETEKILVSKYENALKSTVLKVAHHGSKTSSIPEFIKLVEPQIALIGVGKNNKFGHPNDQVIEELKKYRNKNF